MQEKSHGIEFRFEDSEEIFIILQENIDKVLMFDLTKNLEISSFGAIKEFYRVGRLVIWVSNIKTENLEEAFKDQVIANFRIMGKSGLFGFHSYIYPCLKNDEEILPYIKVVKLAEKNKFNQELVKLIIESPEKPSNSKEKELNMKF